MTQVELKVLLNKYTEGTLSTQEQVRLNQWYLYQAKIGKPLTDAAIYEKRMRELNESLFAAQDEGTRTTKLWPRIAGAAAAVAAITLGVWMYYSSSRLSNPQSQTKGSDLYTNDIAPGKNTATLTLANGKTIKLDTNRTSVVVADSVQAMTMLTAATPRGGTYQVTLPDGTNVWLNADSKISFPSQFNGKERKIMLEGEAYFEVAKMYSASQANAAKGDLIPFIVESANQQVQVLGTHFNINSYEDEISTKTTLLEGSVAVSSLRGGTTKQSEKAVMLKPNEQATRLSTGQIKVSEVDTEQTVAWKNGMFLFEEEGLESIMKKISRWYDIDVVYEDPQSAKEVFAGGITRYESVSKVLRMLEKAGDVKFKIEGRKITVMK